MHGCTWPRNHAPHAASPSVRRALPPVGVHSTAEQLPHSTTLWEWLKTVVMLKQPWHLRGTKRGEGAAGDERACMGGRCVGPLLTAVPLQGPARMGRWWLLPAPCAPALLAAAATHASCCAALPLCLLDVHEERVRALHQALALVLLLLVLLGGVQKIDIRLEHLYW